MDSLSGLLDGARATDAFTLRVLLDPPWSIRIEDRAPLSLVAVTAGSVWLLPDGDDPVRIDAGDILLARGDRPYVLADDVATEPRVVIHPGQICTTIDGVDLADELGLGVRTWGTGSGARDRMLVGVYESAPEVGSRLLRSLPPWAVVRSGEHSSALVELLADELVTDRPGQEVILNRLLDLLVISTARALFDRDDDTAPGWYRAMADPVVGPAIRLFHQAPEQRWTVATTAAAVGVSRAGLARRFSELVGEPPMAFLTAWRMSLAADRLRTGDESVGAVAARVGYANPYAFSTAFKRVMGVSPSRYRSR